MHVPDEEAGPRLRFDAIQHREHSLLCERRQFVGTVGVPQMGPRPARRLDAAVHAEVERLVDRRPSQLAGAFDGSRFACGVGRPEEHRRPVDARGRDRVGHGVPPDQGALVVVDRGFECVRLVRVLPGGHEPRERERRLLRGVPVPGELRDAVDAGGGLGMLFERVRDDVSGARPARRAAVRRGRLGAGARAGTRTRLPRQPARRRRRPHARPPEPGRPAARMRGPARPRGDRAPMTAATETRCRASSSSDMNRASMRSRSVAGMPLDPAAATSSSTNSGFPSESRAIRSRSAAAAASPSRIDAISVVVAAGRRSSTTRSAARRPSCATRSRSVVLSSGRKAATSRIGIRRRLEAT